MSCIHLFGHHNWNRNMVLTRFRAICGPKLALPALRRAKIAQHDLKIGPFHLFVQLTWWNQSWFYNPLKCLGWT